MTTEKASASAPAGPSRRPIRLGTFRFSAVELLVALFLLFALTPFVEDLPQGDTLEVALLTLVMISAVFAVGGRTRTLTMAVALVVPALAARWLHHLRPGLIPPPVYLVAAVAFFGFVIGHLLWFILRSPRVDANVLCAGLSGYLLLGLLWVPLYVTAAHLNPAAFSLPAGPEGKATMDGFSAFYFSFTTLSTVGFGDITPVSRGARTLSVMEAVAGLFYTAVLISRLVAAYSTAPTPTDSKTGPPA